MKEGKIEGIGSVALGRETAFPSFCFNLLEGNKERKKMISFDIIIAHFYMKGEKLFHAQMVEKWINPFISFFFITFGTSFFFFPFHSPSYQLAVTYSPLLICFHPQFPRVYFIFSIRSLCGCSPHDVNFFIMIHESSLLLNEPLN